MGIRARYHFQIKAYIMANHIIAGNRIVYKGIQYRKQMGSVGCTEFVRYSMNRHGRGRDAKVSRLFNDTIAFNLDTSTFQIINNVRKPYYGCKQSWRWKSRCFSIKYRETHSFIQAVHCIRFQFYLLSDNPAIFPQTGAKAAAAPARGRPMSADRVAKKDYPIMMNDKNENTGESTELTRAIARADRLERELAESQRELGRVQALVAARPARKSATKKAVPMSEDEMHCISQTLGTACKLAVWLGETFGEHDVLRTYVAKLVKVVKKHFDRPAKGAKTLSRTVIPAANALAKAVQMDLDQGDKETLASALEKLARAMAWRKLTAMEPISAPDEDEEEDEGVETTSPAQKPLGCSLNLHTPAKNKKANDANDEKEEEEEEMDEEDDGLGDEPARRVTTSTPPPAHNEDGWEVDGWGLDDKLVDMFTTMTLEKALDTSRTFRELFAGREAECENHSAFVVTMNGKMKVVSYKKTRLASCMNGKWVYSQTNADTPLEFIE